MCANNSNNTDNTNSTTSTTSTTSSNPTSSSSRTRKATSLKMNELEANLPSFLPPMITSKRRITSRDWNLGRNLNDTEVSSLPTDFSFPDTSLENDYETSALQSFSESERSCQSLFSDSSEISCCSVGGGFNQGERCTTKTFCEPTDLDVLLGRGGLTNNHAGNIRYREEVEKVKPMYFSCLTKSEKKEVSELLVAYVQDYGGRFLEKDPETKEWVLASETAARKKASQALRETKWKQTLVKKDQPG